MGIERAVGKIGDRRSMQKEKSSRERKEDGRAGEDYE